LKASHLVEYDLHIYSAGAVAPPLKKAIAIFESRFKAHCNLTVGKSHELLVEVASKKAGDVIACGAEYILDDAEDRGLVVKGSRKSLGLRRSVIVVPVGNPAKIASLSDLCKDGVRIGIATEGCLKGVWDDVSAKAGLTNRIRRNITHHADGCGSVMSLIHEKKVDAIFGWNAFRYIWPNTCETVELTDALQVFRSTSVGVISFSKNTQLSQRFIDFLTEDEMNAIYSNYGWIHEQTALH
jgi:molybdate transport system substrate-binding protein